MTVKRMVAAGVAAVAAYGALGAAPAAAQAGTAQAGTAQGSPHWTRHLGSDIIRDFPSMAYDAATGNTVLFGGKTAKNLGPSPDTFTWDGTSWTQQHPATSPHGRFGAAMAYDAATGTVVLFGGDRGDRHHPLLINNTWTWDGTTWTRQAPATSPGARDFAAMAYDAATGTAVLFGGQNSTGRVLGDTWTWDGTTWTKQHPAASPRPRFGAVMAYDAATGNVVLFGGDSGSKSGNGVLGSTWIWDGTTWTEQHPAASPPARVNAAMAYDAATSTAVLFGGDIYDSTISTTGLLADTWTWDGTTWTQHTPKFHPPALEEAGMAYDAATGSAVLAGGSQPGRRGFPEKSKATWTWG